MAFDLFWTLLALLSQQPAVDIFLNFRAEIHLALHLLLPLLIAGLFYRKIFFKAALVMLLTLLIDLDHLLADPIFDPNRCSIGFHPLHSGVAITLYALLPLWKRSRLFAWGLWLHILLDASDCILMKQPIVVMNILWQISRIDTGQLYTYIP